MLASEALAAIDGALAGSVSSQDQKWIIFDVDAPLGRAFAVVPLSERLAEQDLPISAANPLYDAIVDMAKSALELEGRWTMLDPADGRPIERLTLAFFATTGLPSGRIIQAADLKLAPSKTL